MEKLKRSGWFWWMTIDSQGVAVLVDLFRAASLDKYKIDAAIFLLQELNGFEYIKFDSRFGAWLQIAVDRFQDNFTIFFEAHDLVLRLMNGSRSRAVDP